MEYENISFIEAVKKLDSDVRINFESKISFNGTKYLKNLRRMINQSKKNSLSIINKDLIKEYCKQQHVSIKENWSPEIIKTFQIGFCTNIDDELYGRITIPIYDVNNNLVGIAGRRVDRKTTNKYRFKEGIRKVDLLYNLNLALPYIIEKKEMIIVEGYRDTWKCWETGLKNTVALMGCKASNQQIKQIIKYGQFNIVIALDNDKSGEEGTEKLIKELKKFCQIRIIQFPEGVKDFSRCNDVIKLYEKAKNIKD